jgi:hypothetical protein
MAFVHGKSTKVYANGYDLTCYLDSIETPAVADVVETSTFCSASKTYIAGMKDATLSAEGFYDSDTDAIDEVMASVFGVEDTLWSWFLNTDAIGSIGYGLKAIQTAYGVNATKDNATRISVASQSQLGRERLVSLHALAQETVTGDGASVDNAALTSSGGSAYIQVTGIATGDVPVLIEHSTDDASWATLSTFTILLADGQNQSVRNTFSGTVNRYVRASWTLDASETITFNIGIHRD